MASIRKRTNKDGTVSYRADVRLKGFPPQRATFKRLTDAKKWAGQTEAAIQENRYFKTAEARKHTFGKLADRYIKETLPKKSASAQKNQGAQIKWWKEQIGHYTLADITAAQITECRERLLSEPNERGRILGPATVNRYLSALSHVFNVAVIEWGWLEDSPLRKVRKSTEPRGRIRFLSDDETDSSGKTIDGERTRLLKACQASDNIYLYTVVVLALSTGMRQGEIMGMTWDDVDIHQGRITLFKTKNGEIRVVPLVGKALGLLQEKDKTRKEEKVRRIDTNLLFPSKTESNNPMDLRAPWLSVLEKAKIEDFRFHDLRHSAASYLAMNGASLAEIAEVLGHKTLQMVKRYAHLSEVHTAGVVTSMNEKMFGK